MKQILKISSKLMLFFLAIFVISCAPTKTMNDLFGIEMQTSDATKFKIYSYSDEAGTTYQATANMNPKIYAYGSFTVQTIDLKIINDSKTPIKANFFTDQFYIIVKDGKRFNLLKGFWEDYPIKSDINPGETLDFSLKIPQDFWDYVGHGFFSEYNTRYAFEDPFKGRKAVQEVVNQIEYVVASLNSETNIVLKPITKPEAENTNP